jgi:glutamyl/glutaminyl-tRNA synthetase
MTTDEFSMSENAPLRFKFMPTPSDRLHVGHAWLLFVIDTCVRALNERGIAAELILVIDRMNWNYTSPDEALTSQYTAGILEDVRLLGVAPHAIVVNTEHPLPHNLASKANSITLDGWHADLQLPCDYYCYNAACDLDLGITHIIRGDDRMPWNAIYEETYTKLGCMLPQLIYLPVLRDFDGYKISGGTKELVVALLARMSCDDLLRRLLAACLVRSEILPSSGQATAQLLEVVRNVLFENNALPCGNWLSFLQLFVKSPRFSILSTRPLEEVG